MRIPFLTRHCRLKHIRDARSVLNMLRGCEASGRTIAQTLRWSYGKTYLVLDALEDRGLVSKRMDYTNLVTRGGIPRRMYRRRDRRQRLKDAIGTFLTEARKLRPQTED